jgi:hypothetical protein
MHPGARRIWAVGKFISSGKQTGSRMNDTQNMTGNFCNLLYRVKGKLLNNLLS